VTSGSAAFAMTELALEKTTSSSRGGIEVIDRMTNTEAICMLEQREKIKEKIPWGVDL
jgi:hypothetical protein